MVARLRAGTEERQKRLQRAMDVLHNQNGHLDLLKQKILTSKTTWLVAGLIESLDQHYQPPPTPTDFTVAATDGSHIDVDRNQPVRCYLINIGTIALHYGTTPDARLDSFPRLYSKDEELIITPLGTKGREQPIEGTLLGIKRSIDECQHLADLVAGLPQNNPTLALLDGTLILWGLEAYPEFVTEILLEKGFLNHLDDMRKLNSGSRLAVASYISFPRSTDVVNTLRLAICPHNPANCDHYCPPGKSRECDIIAGIRDWELFSSQLETGERSATFISQSSIIQKYYGKHHICFFYIKVDGEIARVEVPQWVAMDENLLNLTHALVLDQCRRGQGYPVVLSEAHEKAVVTGADRQEFWQLVETSLVDEHLPSLISAKSRSKRTRWV